MQYMIYFDLYFYLHFYVTWYLCKLVTEYGCFGNRWQSLSFAQITIDTVLQAERWGHVTGRMPLVSDFLIRWSTCVYIVYKSSSTTNSCRKFREWKLLVGLVSRGVRLGRGTDLKKSHPPGKTILLYVSFWRRKITLLLILRARGDQKDTRTPFYQQNLNVFTSKLLWRLMIRVFVCKGTDV